MKDSNKYLYLILLGLGFVYLRSSYGKLTSGEFVKTLAGTLDKFASKNPYPWEVTFLKSIVIPHAQLFGWLTMLGELFTGVTLTAISLYILFNKNASKSANLLLMVGLLVAAFLNLVFYFAAGWTSSSTESLNLVMFIVEVVGVIYVFKWITSR